jgi:hypothetical protein
VRGAYTRCLFTWNTNIHHDHTHDEKTLRYKIGEDRLAILQAQALPFAYKNSAQGQEVAFLNILDEENLDSRMPEWVRCEYLCARERDGYPSEFIFFSYQWFSSVANAKSFALRHGMQIQGGW